MLKTVTSPEKSTSDRLKIDNDKGSNSIGGIEITKKSGKLKDQKLSKSQKSAKLGKNLSKDGNSPNFDAKDDGPSFLTSKARATFNCLWLAFTKALIF